MTAHIITEARVDLGINLKEKTSVTKYNPDTMKEMTATINFEMTAF